MNKMVNQEKRKRGGEREEGEGRKGEGRRGEGRRGKGGGGREEGGREEGGREERPTQYVWVVFEPPCHLFPEHGEMVLNLLFVVIETLPVCVCVCVCVGGGGGEGGGVGRTSSHFRLEMDNKV